MQTRPLLSKQYTPWQLIRSYWQSEHRFAAYIFIVAVIAMTIAIVSLEVVLNYWYNDFYDALQDYSKHKVIDLMYVFLF